MAFRTWGRLLLTALGVSMLAGAGQLGIAYGFGIVRLTGDFTDVNRWPAQLAWVGWFAVTAAVVGAVLTGRLVRREGLPQDTPVQLAISGAAALGALVVAPLCMQPARAAELSAVDPVWAVGICAVAGAVVGAAAASAVLLRPPLGWNVALMGGAVWLVALVSAAPGVLSTDPLRTVRLGVLEPAWLGADRAQQLAMLLLPVVALVAGAVTGGVARRRGHVPLIGGAAGAAGPVLLAFAYLTAGPGDAVDRYQLAPYYAAVIAVATGALGSVAATLLRWPLLPARPAADDAGDDAAIEPTDILAPLPTAPDAPRPDPTGAVSPATGPTGTGSPTGPGSTTGTGSDEAVTVELSAAARAFDPEPPRVGRTPAHWDWPDPAATVTDRPATRPAPTPGGPARIGSTPTEPIPTEPPRVEPARVEPPRVEPAPARSTRAETSQTAPTAAKQRKATGPATGEEPEAAPRPGAKRTSRTRPAAVVPVAETGQPAPDPAAPTGTGSAETDRPAVTEPRHTRPASGGLEGTGPQPTRQGRSGTGSTAADRPGVAGPGGARPAATAAEAGPARAGTRHVPPDGVESMPRPRHQLPDLSGTGGPADSPRPEPARASLPFPEPDTTERTEPPGPVSLRWEGDSSRSTAPVDDTSPGAAPAGPAPSGDGQQPAGRAKGRRGLFRRNRSPEGESAGDPPAEPATADDEYVDWVAGLSKPLADNEPERESGRRSLRTSGRHHHHD
ncbi:hypothetical protein AB0K25_07480 [Micromonospora sp. NPDC049257]|uniref:hypothetical protein n=1 Tax=Micromonospora sp. NPDC049257 TaxID=3155771 RepID=UPI003441D344